VTCTGITVKGGPETFPFYGDGLTFPLCVKIEEAISGHEWLAFL